MLRQWKEFHKEKLEGNYEQWEFTCDCGGTIIVDNTELTMVICSKCKTKKFEVRYVTPTLHVSKVVGEEKEEDNTVRSSVPHMHPLGFLT